MYAQAHQTTARYPREDSEFAQVGLTEEYSALIKAPYVEESPIKSGLRLIETQTLAVNDTVLVIGEIVELMLADGLMATDGQLDHGAADVVAVTGLDEYHTATSLGRLPYAKP